MIVGDKVGYGPANEAYCLLMAYVREEGKIGYKYNKEELSGPRWVGFSIMKSMEKNWVTLSWSHDKRFDEMQKFFEERGIEAKHRHMDGSMRGFLTAVGKEYNEPLAFHGGHYVGNLESLKRYFFWTDKNEDSDHPGHA